MYCLLGVERCMTDGKVLVNKSTVPVHVSHVKVLHLQKWRIKCCGWSGGCNWPILLQQNINPKSLGNAVLQYLMTHGPHPEWPLLCCFRTCNSIVSPNITLWHFTFPLLHLFPFFSSLDIHLFSLLYFCFFSYFCFVAIISVLHWWFLL